MLPHQTHYHNVTTSKWSRLLFDENIQQNDNGMSLLINTLLLIRGQETAYQYNVRFGETLEVFTYKLPTNYYKIDMGLFISHLTLNVTVFGCLLTLRIIFGALDQQN